jgi:hypothetical protein
MIFRESLLRLIIYWIQFGSAYIIIYSRGELAGAHRSTGRGWIVRGRRVSSACLFYSVDCVWIGVSHLFEGDANVWLLCVYPCVLAWGGLSDIDEICCGSLSRCCRFDDVFAAALIIPPFHF